jgi:hypothetical protein
MCDHAWLQILKYFGFWFWQNWVLNSGPHH